MKTSEFVHLRNYSQYSLSRGALRISELIDFCKNQNVPATAITDFDNLFGSLEFCLETVKNGIQPIIGTNIFLKDKKFKNGYLLLLCKNEIGYKNLVKLISHSYLNNLEMNSPYILIEDLKKYSRGLICLAGGKFGIITKNLNESLILSKELIQILNQIFTNDFFLEIQRYRNDSSINEKHLINFSSNMGIPLVATNENFFYKEDFFKTHDALLSISQQKYVDSDDRIKSEKEFYLKSVEEMVTNFSDIPQAIANTTRIAKKCSFFLEEKPPNLPKIKSDRFDENTMLRNISENGLEKRLKENSLFEKREEYKKRLDFELNIIVKMGYSSYFLIVSDFINWAKNNMIPVGPGRGSGAGSLVAWCLSITNLDPLKFGLIFERFLNPERISLPDFDIDFCMDKRDDVIKYVQKNMVYLM